MICRKSNHTVIDAQKRNPRMCNKIQQVNFELRTILPRNKNPPMCTKPNNNSYFYAAQKGLPLEYGLASVLSSSVTSASSSSSSYSTSLIPSTAKISTGEEAEVLVTGGGGGMLLDATAPVIAVVADGIGFGRGGSIPLDAALEFELLLGIGLCEAKLEIAPKIGGGPMLI